MAERLNDARKLANKAWEEGQADAYICNEMVRVGGTLCSRKEFDLWFERGKNIDPVYYDLYLTRLNFLQANWGGSDEQLLSFGRECVATGTWREMIPMVLIAAHDMCGYGFAYFGKKEVWTDIQSVYEPYLQKFPNNNVQKSAYCYYAVQAQKWDLAKKLLDELGDLAVDHGFKGTLKECRNLIQANTTSRKKADY